MSQRLDSLLSQSGYCARRKVAEFLQQHEVKRGDGTRLLVPGERIEESEQVSVDGIVVCIQVQHLYIMLNKPQGYLSALSDPYGRRLAVDLLPMAKDTRLYNVGRLDEDSEGLLLFTNDGYFAQQIMHPRYCIEKEYHVWSNRPITADILQKMMQGIEEGGDFLKIIAYRYLSQKSPYAVSVTLADGKNREIRRLFTFFGLRVQRLLRVRIGHLCLNQLATGDYQILSDKHIAQFIKNC